MLCLPSLDKKIIAEEMSSCRGNQHRTEIIDQDFVPGTMLRCLVIQG